MKKLALVLLALQLQADVCKETLGEYQFVCANQMLFFEKVVVKEDSITTMTGAGYGVGVGVGLTYVTDKSCKCSYTPIRDPKGEKPTKVITEVEIR